MKLLVIFALFFLSSALSGAQETDTFRPSETNVWGAEYPRVDSTGKVQVRVKIMSFFAHTAHTPFSMIMTGLGIVALAGIVVKNGIVLTDTYNHYNRDDGVEPVKAMGFEEGRLSKLGARLRALSGHYDQAARSAASL